jgi:hypothetical protein
MLVPAAAGEGSLGVCGLRFDPQLLRARHELRDNKRRGRRRRPWARRAGKAGAAAGANGGGGRSEGGQEAVEAAHAQLDLRVRHGGRDAIELTQQREQCRRALAASTETYLLVLPPIPPAG